MGDAALVVRVDEDRHEPGRLTDEQITLLKESICKGAPQVEIDVFLQLCRHKRLDPFSRQIYLIPRRQKVDGQYVDVYTPQTSIDGFRAIAHRTKLMDGADPPMWCGPDGAWREVWLDRNNPPAAAKFTVYKRGARHGFTAVAIFGEYAQTYRRDGQMHLTAMWARMPALMIAKCAEALALRKAFPEDLSGIYTDDEMAQADSEPRSLQADVRADDEERYDAALASHTQQKSHDTEWGLAQIEALNALGEHAVEMMEQARGDDLMCEQAAEDVELRLRDWAQEHARRWDVMKDFSKKKSIHARVRKILKVIGSTVQANDYLRPFLEVIEAEPVDDEEAA